ncbi:MAG TPA: hypothetical protein VFJ65_08680 [Solirubrobacterales bacterium]|nr:hypothetical protein [Solirubrobacterales bacterium]
MEGGKTATHQLTGEKLWLLRGGVIGLAIVIALVALVVSGGEDEGPAAPPEAESKIVSEEELAERAAALGQPIYWAGPVPGTVLELEQLEGEEGVCVRYLPEGSGVGEAPPSALTVGSYPRSPAALEEFAAEPGSVTRQGPNGREVVYSEENPTSAYFNDPEGLVQVEVYDPSPQKALSLALSGKAAPAE